MAGYTNSPTGPLPSITQYKNSPTSSPTPATHFVSSPGPFAPPGLPLLWFSAQDINLLANAGINDADPVGTWKNKGSLGTAWDVTQAGAARPLYRRVAAAGKINNLSAVESDGTMFMNNAGGLPAISQPNILAVIFKVTSFAANGIVFDGQSGVSSDLGYLNSPAGTLAINSGTNQNVQVIPAATWEVCVTTFNGASSFNRLNGSQSATVNTGTNTPTGASLYNFGGGIIMNGMIAELLLWGPTSPPTSTDIEAYFAGVYGVTPQ